MYPISIHPALIILLAVLVIWELIWKGIALYTAAQHKQVGWFVTILIINSAGILPILYLAFFQYSKTSKSRKTK